MSDLIIRVEEYKSVTANDGRKKIVATDHGMRLNPSQVTHIYTAGTGYETDLTTTHNVFTVYLSSNAKFITDWSGIQSITNWIPPTAL